MTQPVGLTPEGHPYCEAYSGQIRRRHFKQAKKVNNASLVCVSNIIIFSQNFIKNFCPSVKVIK